ncbi:NAD(P)-binding protein [Rhizoclosmatium globosum]|uniref:NAD(P)-binding protein n=1 Tax=Rhizoclosmatium globosum TaxID=329046 RepID=A0A1Y2CQA3_9FUNG|nr:NAD(P)-binding protein [Rhizoclosmatium globosum]|eukprot:ORY49137.1 NAD(P)-binding protein [Rhizoclosmatium globosum]
MSSEMETDSIVETGDEELGTHFTSADLESTAKVLAALNTSPALKRFAKTNATLRDVLALGHRVFRPSDDEKKSFVKKQKKNLRDDDLKLLDDAGIRKMRLVKMVGMIGGSVDLQKPPRIANPEDVDKFIAEDEAKTAAAIKAEAEKLMQQPAASVLPEESSSTPLFTHVEADPTVDQLPPPKKLNYKRSCHICGALFNELHAFYDQLCLPCATFNYTKRFSKANMKGRVCIVTGARVKIGYAIALKLLRMDAAKVIVTTRFPHDAARRFAAEPDSDTFKDRLTIYGLDFRDIRMMHHFCAHIRAKETRLDVIINNAAQTVRKPPGFYEHLMSGEAVEMLGPEVLEKVEVVDVFRVGDKYLFGSPDVAAAEAKRLMGSASSAAAKLNVVSSGDHVELATNAAVQGDVLMATPAKNAINLGTDFIPADPGSAASLALKDGVVVNEAASMSQIPMMASDITSAAQSTELFPKGLYDRDDQQVDLRTQNSWNLEMGQISTVEMMECHVINSFAPWVLISELKSLMEASGPVDGSTLPEGTFFDKYVVNVSAMEGQFYRNKTIFHPHTNMAKASLNMMTRTAAAGFAAVGIFMTAVDTGWITDEQPQHLWEKRANQPPPLDEWDAAMRVLDPVMCGVRGEEKVWGAFLKNYKPTRW